MTDYSKQNSFPRIPRDNQINLDLILFFIIISLVVIAFSIAGKEDMTTAGFASEGMIKTTISIHEKEQKDRDERAALYFYSERAKR